MADGIVGQLKTMLETNMQTTQDMRKVESDHNLKLQMNKMTHDSDKAVIDALKAAANNVAQMGRAQ